MNSTDKQEKQKPSQPIRLHAASLGCDGRLPSAEWMARESSANRYAASWSALWTLDGGIFNSRAMARRPRPCAFSFLTSSARPLMVAGRPSWTPRALAAANPAFTRSLMIPRSNSATAIKTPNCSRPAGLSSLVSMPWLLAMRGTLSRFNSSRIRASVTYAADKESAKAAPAPVILDTDIGGDIDDTWALGLLLKSSELHLKLVAGDAGQASYRARVLARFLERVGRDAVPGPVGLDIEPRGEGGQAAWVKGYELKSYPGKVYSDGVQALIDTIMNSKQPVTLIC